MKWPMPMDTILPCSSGRRKRVNSPLKNYKANRRLRSPPGFNQNAGVEELSNTAQPRPLCVDLDGTLVEADTMEDLIAAFLRARFWRVWQFPLWLLRGRACFKRRLASAITLQLDRLPVHREFLEFLKAEHARGRTLVLASAADETLVKQVADYFKIFAGSVGSDGKTNLRGEAKRQRLTELYGVKGFDYAGNSSVDYPVWAGAAEAIVVNARPAVELRAREIATVSRVFPRRTSRMELWKRLWR